MSIEIADRCKNKQKMAAEQVSFSVADINREFDRAVDLVLGNAPLIFITGAAGTGKTHFLKHIRGRKPNTLVLAFTGVAAINADGQTLNSFFQIPPCDLFLPGDERLKRRAVKSNPDTETIYKKFQYKKYKQEILETVETIIIDEVSTVRCDTLDVIDSILRAFSKRGAHKPFGGVQIILIGDMYQLPPVLEQNAKKILLENYESPYFFSAECVRDSSLHHIEFKKVHRQRDHAFISLLGRIRRNKVTADDLNLLESRYHPTFSGDEKNNYVTIATHNKIVDGINFGRLTALPGELRIFEGMVTGVFPKDKMPTNQYLYLKEGAQIMFVKNNWQKGYYNGTLGKIQKIEGDKIIVRYYSDKYKQHKEELLEHEVWDNTEYIVNKIEKKIDNKTVGRYTQYPVKLAWAITIHKSQGLTLDKVVIDAGASFDYGQVYVALSRCRSLDGLILKSRIERSSIMVDPIVQKFVSTL